MSVQYKTADGWKNISSSSNNAVDTVENGNMSPVTSNAVYDKLDVVGQVYDISPAAFTLSGSSQAVNCGALNKGKYIIEVSLLSFIGYDECKLFVVGGTVPVVNVGRCNNVSGAFQQTGVGFANITADNTPMVLIFGGNLSGSTNGDKNFWFVKAIRIG